MLQRSGWGWRPGPGQADHLSGSGWFQREWSRQWHGQFYPGCSQAIQRQTWFSHLALAIYMFVFVTFDALAQANDI